jgi:hypothetical protein
VPSLSPAQSALYKALLASRSTARDLLGVTNQTAAATVVAFRDAGENAERFAAYLGVPAVARFEGTPRLAETYENVILYGHISYAPLPFGQHGTDPGRPRLGESESKALTPDQVFAGLPRGVKRLSVIGCNSARFKVHLAGLAPGLRIVYTDLPFHWKNAGALKYIHALDKETGESKDKFTDILKEDPLEDVVEDEKGAAEEEEEGGPEL